MKFEVKDNPRIFNEKEERGEQLSVTEEEGKASCVEGHIEEIREGSD